MSAYTGMLQPEDVTLIQRQVMSLPADRDVMVIDLGAGTGSTALAVANARQSGIRIISIDVNQACLDAAQAALRTVPGFDVDKQWLGIRSRSDAVPAVYIDNCGVDLLMCDATHDYASQQDELNAWFGWLNSNCLLWIHEYHGYAHGLYPGVKQAVDEFIAAGLFETIAVDGWSWIGEFKSRPR